LPAQTRIQALCVPQIVAQTLAQLLLEISQAVSASSFIREECCHVRRR